MNVCGERVRPRRNLVSPELGFIRLKPAPDMKLFPLGTRRCCNVKSKLQQRCVPSRLEQLQSSGL